MDDFLKNNQKLLTFLLIGLILIGFGVLSYKTDMFSSGDKVEVLNATTGDENDTLEIVVEIAGAVEKPGVYKFKNSARIDDLLISAGGISASADRGWVEKYINKASKLIDGQKVYVYHLGEVSAKDSDSIKLDQSILGDKTGDVGKFININTPSQQELEMLTGIGPVYATKIVEHRPYSNSQELVTKGVIGQKVFEKIKNEISVY